MINDLFVVYVVFGFDVCMVSGIFGSWVVVNQFDDSYWCVVVMMEVCFENVCVVVIMFVIVAVQCVEQFFDLFFIMDFGYCQMMIVQVVMFCQCDQFVYEWGQFFGFWECGDDLFVFDQ